MTTEKIYLEIDDKEELIGTIKSLAGVLFTATCYINVEGDEKDSSLPGGMLLLVNLITKLEDVESNEQKLRFAAQKRLENKS